MPTSVMKAVPPGRIALVGGLHVGVGPDHRGDLAVEVRAHGVLLAGGLAVHVDEDAGAALRLQLGHQPVGGAEGVVEVLHEDPPLEVQHAELAPVGGLDDGVARARARPAGSWPGGAASSPGPRGRGRCPASTRCGSRW